MSKRLDNLRRLLTEPLGAHIDDQRLAEMAAAISAGEDVDALFATELAHIEQCLACAAEYDELVTLSVTAVTDMSLAAQEISPQEVFAELIRRAADVSLDRTMVRQLIAALPFLFTQPPASPTEFDETLAGNDLAEQRTHLPILQAVRHNLAALAAYLTSASNAVWGRVLQTEITTAAQGYSLNFQPALAPAVPTLSSGVVGEEWELFSRRVGQMPPLHVDVRAQRQTDLACRLIVQVDRPGLVSAAGRQVTVQFAEESVTQVTDYNGNVTFSDIPIAALAGLVLTIAEQT